MGMLALAMFISLTVVALGIGLVVYDMKTHSITRGFRDRREVKASNAKILGTARPEPKTAPEEARAYLKGTSDVVAGWIKWARDDGTYTKTNITSIEDLDTLVRTRPPLTATVAELQAHLVKLRGAIDAAELYRRTGPTYEANAHTAARITLLREDTFDPTTVEDLYYLTHTDVAVAQAYIKGTERGMEVITKQVIAAREGIRTALSRQAHGRGQGEALKALVHELSVKDPAAQWDTAYNDEPSQ